VLPSAVTARVSIEAAIAQPWWRWLGPHSWPISLEHYGACAHATALFKDFGITPDATVAAAEESLAAARAAAGPSTQSSPERLDDADADYPQA
jgi:transketolase